MKKPSLSVLEPFYDAVEAGATIRPIASVFHFNLISTPELQDYGFSLPPEFFHTFLDNVKPCYIK